MKIKIIPKTDINVSVIGLGTWSYELNSGFWGGNAPNESIKAIHKAIDSGTTLIDTAPVYGKGESETIVGKAIKGKREKLIISTKCGFRWNEQNKIYKDLSAESIQFEIENSLKRLRTDYIDIYFIHHPSNGCHVSETAGKLEELKKQGIIRSIGVSNYSLSQIKELSEYIDIDLVQPQYSLLNRKIEEEIIPWCEKNNIGIMSYGSIGGGILSGKYNKDNLPSDQRSDFYDFFNEPLYTKALSLIEKLKKIAYDLDISLPQLALAWTVKQRGMISALAGARNGQQAQQNAFAGNIDLSDDILCKIEQAYKNTMI